MTQVFSTGAGAMRRAYQIARRWSASIALLAFQVAPVDVRQSAAGKFDVGIGFTADQYLQESFSCGGAKLSDRAIESKVVSAVFDYLPREALRFSGFVGSASATTGECSTTIEAPCSFPTPFSGAFAGVQVAHERKSVGVGIGIATMPDGDYTEDPGAEAISHTMRPTFHARVGDREKKYVRLDINSVRTPGQVPMSTLGLGFGRRGYNTERGFIGIGFLPYENVGDGVPSVITGNVAIPVATLGDVLLGGYAGAGRSRGISVGARLHMSGGK